MRLTNKIVAILVENQYEDLELWYTYYRLKEEGAKVLLVGPKSNTTYNSKHNYPATSEASASDISASDLDGVVIPGGYAPDRIRRDFAMVNLVRKAYDVGKLICFICHGGWVPISAGILRDKQVTGFFSIKDDLMNAGAIYIDQPVVRDENIISSRIPDDLPDFCRVMITALSETQELN